MPAAADADVVRNVLLFMTGTMRATHAPVKAGDVKRALVDASFFRSQVRLEAPPANGTVIQPPPDEWTLTSEKVTPCVRYCRFCAARS